MAASLQMMTVVPTGVAPGGMFTVQTPSGQMMSVTCPPGVAEGQQIQIAVPAPSADSGAAAAAAAASSASAAFASACFFFSRIMLSLSLTQHNVDRKSVRFCEAGSATGARRSPACV